MICPECGHQNPDNALFCEECGASVNNFHANNSAAFRTCDLCGKNSADEHPAKINNRPMNFCTDCYNEVHLLINNSKYRTNSFIKAHRQFLLKYQCSAVSMFISDYLKAKYSENMPRFSGIVEFDDTTPAGYCVICKRNRGASKALINNIQMDLCPACFNDTQRLINFSKTGASSFRAENDAYLSLHIDSVNAKFISEYIKAKNVDKTVGNGNAFSGFQ